VSVATVSAALKDFVYFCSTLLGCGVLIRVYFFSFFFRTKRRKDRQRGVRRMMIWLRLGRIMLKSRLRRCMSFSILLPITHTQTPAPILQRLPKTRNCLARSLHPQTVQTDRRGRFRLGRRKTQEKAQSVLPCGGTGKVL
jgi:hypothetical protein